MNSVSEITTSASPKDEIHRAAFCPENAPPTSRILAAFVDYLVIASMLFLAGSLSVPPDMHFLFALIGGAVYLGIGNSSYTLGRTLGKRAFGLQVISIDGREPHLSIPRSLLRYLLCFGLIILLVELPPIYFRAAAVAANPYLLELPMLAVLVLFFGNIALVFSDRRGEGFHDRLSGSMVVRLSSEFLEPELNPSAFFPQRTGRFPAPTRFAVGGALGAALWLAGLLHPESVLAVHAERYLLERRHHLRIAAVSEQGAKFSVDALLLSEKPGAETAQALGRDILLLTELHADSMEEVEIRLIRPHRGAQEETFVFDKNTGELR